MSTANSAYLMNPSNQDRYLTEEIHYPERCQFPDCTDDIIPNPNGVDRYCFKHLDYTDR